jgi:hypothetical protein
MEKKVCVLIYTILSFSRGRNYSVNRGITVFVFNLQQEFEYDPKVLIGIHT